MQLLPSLLLLLLHLSLPQLFPLAVAAAVVVAVAAAPIYASTVPAVAVAAPVSVVGSSGCGNVWGMAHNGSERSGPPREPPLPQVV